MAPDGVCLKMAPAEVVHSQRRQEKLVKEPVRCEKNVSYTTLLI